MAELIIVYTTVPDSATADVVAQDLVSQRLAACVQISSPIQSHYVWKGTAKRDQEYRLSVKTRGALFNQVAEAIEKHHPYEVPEILSVPVVQCSSAYKEWLLSQTKHTTDSH